MTSTRTQIAVASFLQWIDLEGLPRPHRDYAFTDRRWWKFTMAWPSRKLAINVTSPTGGVARFKRHLAEEEGWQVVWVTTETLGTMTTARIVLALLGPMDTR